MKVFIKICIVLLLVSCYGIKKPEKPKNLISKDKMVNVLIDMSLFNSAKGVNKRVLENRGIDLEQFVYDKHNIDSLQFVTSNKYYAYNVEEYEAIYDRVKDSLTELKDEYSKIENKRKRTKQKKDSIRRLNRRDSISKAKQGNNSSKKPKLYESSKYKSKQSQSSSPE